MALSQSAGQMSLVYESVELEHTLSPTDPMLLSIVSGWDDPAATPAPVEPTAPVAGARPSVETVGKKRIAEHFTEAQSSASDWQPEEDKLLRLAVRLYGENTDSWTKIAAYVPGRATQNCRDRWFQALNPSLHCGPWTPEEDDMLRHAYHYYPDQWRRIADLVPGRTDEQCSKRWRDHLNPAIDHSEWTPSEDRDLLRLVVEYRNHWQRVAEHFPGRPGLHCRNRWRRITRVTGTNKRQRTNASGKYASVDTFGRGEDNHHRGDNDNEASANDDEGDEDSDADADDDDASMLLPGVMTHAKAPVVVVNYVNNSQLGGPTEAAILSSVDTSATAVVAHQLPYPDYGEERPATRKAARAARDVLNASPASGELAEGPAVYGCAYPGCREKFTTHFNLSYHYKRTHAGLGTPIDRPYRCAMSGCAKRYKNIGGLQYHILRAKGSAGHTHARGAEAEELANETVTSTAVTTQTAPVSQFLAESNAISTATELPPSTDSPTTPAMSVQIANPSTDDTKPYWCTVPACPKRYRNANGLKYHMKHAHPALRPPDIPVVVADPSRSRPFMCPATDCRRRYASVASVHYHICREHSALQHTLMPIVGGGGGGGQSAASEAAADTTPDDYQQEDPSSDSCHAEELPSLPTPAS